MQILQLLILHTSSDEISIFLFSRARLISWPKTYIEYYIALANIKYYIALAKLYNLILHESNHTFT